MKLIFKKIVHKINERLKKPLLLYSYDKFMLAN